MRRTSIVGPIVLIVIGTLFLLRNFIPNIQVMELVSAYWPYGLIAWGVLRLVEVVILNQNGQLSAKSGISSGEWVMIGFICVIGSSVFWGVKQRELWSNRFSLGAWEIMGEAYDYPVAGTLKAGKTPRILIENSRGNSRVIGTDGEEVKVTGTKTIRSMNRADADRDDKNSPFEIVQQGEVLVIRTNLDRVGSGPQLKADLEIMVPRGARVESKSRYGDLDLENIGGDVEVTSENAGIRLNNVGGNVRADLRKSDVIRVVNARGNVEVKGRGQDVEIENVTGTVSVNGTYSGDILFRQIGKQLRFESASTNLRVEKVAGLLRISGGTMTGNQVTGPVVLRAKSKDVELTDFTESVSLDVDRGDITLRPVRTAVGKMDAKTNAGEIELVLPLAAKFEISAKTRRGEIENDYGSPLQVKGEERGATLSGSVGGGPRLALETDRGTIRIRKSGERFESSEAPKPAEAPLAPVVPKAPVTLERSVQ